MIMAKRTIRPQERCFCIWYAMLCNVQEAALHAATAPKASKNSVRVAQAGQLKFGKR